MIFFFFHILIKIIIFGGLIMDDKSYHIANITEADEIAIKEAEAYIKKETGKDFIMIAWEKE